jgi:hypothetical protein
MELTLSLFSCHLTFTYAGTLNMLMLYAHQGCIGDLCKHQKLKCILRLEYEYTYLCANNTTQVILSSDTVTHLCDKMTMTKVWFKLGQEDLDRVMIDLETSFIVDLRDAIHEKYREGLLKAKSNKCRVSANLRKCK